MAWHIGALPVGSIALPLLESMRRAGLPFVHGPGGVALKGVPDAALHRIAGWLRAEGHAGAWRDELLAVRAGVGGPAVARVERGVARNLGIATASIQLHAHAADSGRWWLQQRAWTKATDPGRWDTLAGGMVAAGESVAQALARESREEAGVRTDRLPHPPLRAGRFTVRRPVDDAGSHGYLVETVHVFGCALPAGLRPANQDGEVLRFADVSDGEIDSLVRSGELTLEAAVAVALCRRSRTTDRSP